VAAGVTVGDVRDVLCDVIDPALVDYSTDTALHPFEPGADTALCALCGEHANWHPSTDDAS
jgi:hypothetical protein